MHLKFYGVRGVFPTSEQMMSAAIWTREGHILIDAGSTSVFEDLCILEKTSHIFITHHHNDHIAMLPNFVVARLVKVGKKCLVVSPESVAEIMRSMELDSNDYDHTTIVPSNTLNLTVESIVTAHPRKNYCYKFSSGESSLVYTGDTTYDLGLAEFCCGVEVLVCEASYSDKNVDHAKYWGHMTPKMVARLINDAKPQTTILTHFVQLEGFEFREAVVKHIGRSVEIVPAYEGLEVDLAE
ncbi:MAG: hypothetical protein DRP09_16810 [Candidatus Thorarchaeota archaeon]|nr:MAG: hypothetical protein DRP09_16810 [Candidatus Thorarchaeota archaeon]